MQFRRAGRGRSRGRVFTGVGRLLACVVALGGCDMQDQQGEFVDEAGQVPSGFTHTTADRTVVENDANDWRTAPIYLGVIRFEPAYPNPSNGDLVTIPFVVTQFNALRGGLVLRARHQDGRFIELDNSLEGTQPGSYVFQFFPSRMGNPDWLQGRLHRLYVFDVDELVTYGDLKIE